MNILLLSVGTRNKIVRYFKENIDGRVIATDCQNLAPALYEADGYYIVPRITDVKYLDYIYKICITERINAVLSLIDPELSLLAKNQDQFKKIGVQVVGSPYELCEMAMDKIQMYKWLDNHGYNSARSYDNLDTFYNDLSKGLISFPVFVKPIRGSASKSINIANDKSTLEFIWSHDSALMIQEYLDGQEIGADVYIDMLSHETVSIFTKKKLLMRSGETDKAVSFINDKLFSLIEQFSQECGWVGQIDIDLFEIDGEYYISEVNPRFGGGYPHAYECGCNHIKLIANNINGIVNKKSIGQYQEGIYMLKYGEILIK